MLEKNYYKVDFSDVKSFDDIHSALDESLNFFEYYRDLDSLYDSLTNMLCDISVIEILGIERLEKYDGYDKKILQTFYDTKHAYEGEFADRFLVTVVREDGTREEIK